MGFLGTNLRVCLSLVIVLLGARVLSSPALALEIRVKPQATVRGDTVYLSDIATFTPVGDARVERLRRLDVASAPAPGNQCTLSEHFLNYKIGSVIDGEEGIRIMVPRSLTVQRTAQEINAKDLEEIFKSYVESRSPWPAEKIVFERISTPGTIALPEGQVEWGVQERGDVQRMGHVTVIVGFRVDGKLIRKVPVSGRVSVVQEVVKAVRRIDAGVQVSEDDLILVREGLGRFRGHALTSLDEVVGKTATRNIRPDQVITPRMVEDPPLVRKGGQVVIRAQKGLIHVTTLGKVIEDGQAGDQVRVINVSSGKQVIATVRGPGVVEVRF